MSVRRGGLAAAATAIACFLVVGCGSSSSSSNAPAFSSSDLAATPSGDWITNGGSLSNDRYSSLDQINDGNVSQLKGVWHIHLHGDAIAAKYSAENQPLVYKGMIYVSNGMDTVYAIDAKTGTTKWEYQAHLDQSISTVCCGWESRGVALGDG